jgi:hypothetical protein
VFDRRLIVAVAKRFGRCTERLERWPDPVAGCHTRDVFDNPVRKIDGCAFEIAATFRSLLLALAFNVTCRGGVLLLGTLSFAGSRIARTPAILG